MAQNVAQLSKISRLARNGTWSTLCWGQFDNFWTRSTVVFICACAV